MRRIFRTISAIVLCLTLAMPLSAADRRHGHSGDPHGGHRTENRHRDDKHNGKHHDKHDDKRGHHGGKRPDNNGGRRPGGYAPGGNHHRPTPPPPPPPAHHRPHGGHSYVPGRWHRPAPPHGYRYVPGCGPSFATILGIALGTALDVSLNSLVNSGYTVSSYGNNMVNLTNVYNLNYLWPDATLYYNNGYFAGGSFVDYAAYNDMSRYNGVYNYLVGRYGAPVSVVNNGYNLSGTWFGDDGRFVTLSYGPNGGHYITTLSYGL